MTWEMIDEGHLGGFLVERDPATFMPRLWKTICEEFQIESVLDVGCGMGYSIIEFNKYCKNVKGIEGSLYARNKSEVSEQIIYHDFTKGILTNLESFDLCWSCEFVEHVEEKYKDNFLDAFSKAKYLAITYAEPGQPGHHHVNCKPKEYWIENVENYGFKYDEETTTRLKKIAFTDAVQINPQYMDNHFYLKGLFFRK